MPAVAKKENTLVSQLEQRLRSHAAHLAIKSKSSELTYADLDNLSARCAGALQRESANRFAPIALMMSHDAHLIAAMIGILRSGGFYFVLNRSVPPARLREIVKEVRPWAIVADSEHAEQAQKLSGAASKFFLLDELLTKTGSFSSAPASENSPFAIFYTSGSSQQPRPVVYPHGGTWHNVTNHSRSLRITADDRITLLSPCSAAASVSAIFGALLNGASLFPFDPVREGLPKLRDWIRTERITVYHSVPSLFRRFAEALEPDEILRSVRTLKLGGEPVFPSDVDLFRRHFGSDSVLVNGLGLTEANGNACHFQIRHDTQISTATVPVGEPLDGIEIRLLRADRTEATSGETSEIALRGKYIAPAFWTGSKVEQYGLDDDGWFRTAELGRRNSYGIFEHLGRRDDQLKLRGQWIS